jgi:hypothetical protein
MRACKATISHGKEVSAGLGYRNSTRKPGPQSIGMSNTASPDYSVNTYASKTPRLWCRVTLAQIENFFRVLLLLIETCIAFYGRHVIYSDVYQSINQSINQHSINLLQPN